MTAPRRAKAPTALVLWLLLGTSGCLTLGSKYERPDVPLPGAYPETTGAESVPIADGWWKEFGDPTLDTLVEQALASNQDLALAAARVSEARALAGLTDAARYPQAFFEAWANRTKLSPETSQLPSTVANPSSKIHAAVDLSYEFDFWGRLARLSDAARAELLASEEGRKNVRLAVIADVTGAYIDLVALDQALVITRATEATRDEQVKLQRLRFEGGSISELDLAQAEATLAASQAAAPIIARLLRQTEDRLGVLLGKLDANLARPARVAESDSLRALTNPPVPAGLPSSLLQRRPDILAAEQRLVAAHARIASARAAYFPILALTGNAGTESRELSGLFASGTNLWQAAFSLLQPIFQGGRTKRQVEAAEARELQAVAVYRKTVQTAFAEVEDALIGRSTGAEQVAALTRQVEALGRARRLSELRYEAGDTSYIEVLDAERDLFRAQLDKTNAQRDELQAAVTLFKALGGGFEPPAGSEIPPPPPPGSTATGPGTPPIGPPTP